MPGAVEVDIPGVVGELLLVVGRDLFGVRGDGQHVCEEVHVRRMVQRRELGVQRVVQDQGATRPTNAVPVCEPNAQRVRSTQQESDWSPSRRCTGCALHPDNADVCRR